MTTFRRPCARAALSALALAIVSPLARGSDGNGATASFALRPDAVIWKTNPAAPAARSASILGGAGQPGLYVARVMLPEGEKVPAHSHPEDRIYTVIRGTFQIGYGDTYDEGRLQSFPPGSVLLVPGRAYHFHAASQGTWVVQINSIGPTSFEYADPGDDPRKH
jgi:quercetin dioxygenase-like cupin family protein